MMIKFNLNNFEPVPEGTRNLLITDAKAVPSGKPSKIEMTFKDTETNRTLMNNYNLTVPGAVNAFGFLCRVAFELQNMDEFDTNNIKDFIGKIVECEVVHTEGTQPRDDGSLPVFANISKVVKLVKPSNNDCVSPREVVSVGDDLD